MCNPNYFMSWRHFNTLFLQFVRDFAQTLRYSHSVSLAALCLLSLRVWLADDWLFSLTSCHSFCVRFIVQLVLIRRELARFIDTGTDPHRQRSVHTYENNFLSSVFLVIGSEYLRPDGSTENDRKSCSSYSGPIGGAWHSPKTEKKRRSMDIKLARCKQTDSRMRNRTQEEDENGSCKETRIVCVDR